MAQPRGLSQAFPPRPAGNTGDKRGAGKWSALLTNKMNKELKNLNACVIVACDGWVQCAGALTSALALSISDRHQAHVLW